jgi:hypothetical protein
MSEEKKEKSVTCDPKLNRYELESSLHDVLVRATNVSAGQSEAMKVQLSSYVRFGT